MSNAFGNVPDPNSIPIRDTTVREQDIKDELNGWNTRRCLANAAEARKQLAMWASPYHDGTIPLAHQFQAGQAQERAETWENRAAAAKRGVFLFDIAGQRDPVFVSDQAIKSLQQRAASLGMCEFENATREPQTRY